HARGGAHPGLHAAARVVGTVDELTETASVLQVRSCGCATVRQGDKARMDLQQPTAGWDGRERRRASDRSFLAQQLPRRTVAMVLAGGRGSRLHDLTDRRAKPAVYFGGKFRIIDFVLSNCVNSGIRRIGLLTQYKSHSLLRHLQRGWNFLRGEANEF